MDAKTWERVKEAFSLAVDLIGDERRQKLDEICGSDPYCRSEVEALLKSNDEFDSFIEEPAFTVADALPYDPALAIDKVIGNYRIVREIGRGGMGTVFLATRDDGEFQQDAAIKVVNSAFLGPESVRRFRQERQILAALNHPNIARLLDGGVTDEGLPYLVMEYVNGSTLIEYADQHGLSVDGRLRVFSKICRAFAYAHGNLIVHRDIKPSNILVTPDGEPKLLDFGLAKILEIGTDEVRTATNFRALTPAYASPEQLRGDPIRTASDIYSLGVVLYELMTGLRPFDYESVTFEKMLQIVSGSEPVKPSAKMIDTPDSDGPKQKIAVKHRLKGDIDNIIMMALRKEPERRYRSVEQLAEDIDRHLRGLPITASEDTFAYRASKFLRRHRIGVASASLILLVLIAGIIATSWQARAARRAQVRSETIGTFMQGILGSASIEAKGADVKLKDVLADAAARARVELADDPEALAKILMTLGRTYGGIALYAEGETELREAVKVSETASGPDDATTGAALAWLGMLLAFEFKSVEGLEVSKRAVDIERKLHSEPHEDLAYALYGYSTNLSQRGDMSGALAAAQEASEIIKGTLGEQHQYYLATLNQIGSVHSALGNTDEAERMYRQTLSRADDSDPRHRIFIAQAAGWLGQMLIKKEEFREAEVLLQRSESIYRVLTGDSNTNIAYLKLQLGKVYIHGREFDRAATELRESLDMFSAFLPPENVLVLQTKTALGVALTRGGKPAEGERNLREALASAAKTLPPDDPLRIDIESTLGECLTARRQFPEAETLLLGALAKQDTPAGAKGHPLVDTRHRLATLYRVMNRPDEAQKYQ